VKEIIMKAWPLIGCLLSAAMVTAKASASEEGAPMRPVHTFSIVAWDGERGEMGVAVQSHWFNVGAIVP